MNAAKLHQEISDEAVRRACSSPSALLQESGEAESRKEFEAGPRVQQAPQIRFRTSFVLRRLEMDVGPKVLEIYSKI